MFPILVDVEFSGAWLPMNLYIVQDNGLFRPSCLCNRRGQKERWDWMPIKIQASLPTNI